jgi:hypothetical protein
MKVEKGGVGVLLGRCHSVAVGAHSGTGGAPANHRPPAARPWLIRQFQRVAQVSRCPLPLRRHGPSSCVGGRGWRRAASRRRSSTQPDRASVSRVAFRPHLSMDRLSDKSGRTSSGGRRGGS